MKARSSSNGHDTNAYNKNNPQKSGRQTRSTLATRAASKQPTPDKSAAGLTNGSTSMQNINRGNTQNSGAITLFGRATSALLQGNVTKKKPFLDSWRCAFLILDNADRILSWKRGSGSINPLTQLFMLPGVMGINLTIIFITRSSILQYSCEYTE